MTSWADVVFHVLAHVPSRLPSSLHSLAYQRFVEGVVGPASERALAEDARVLAAVLRDHASLTAVQALAWQWSTPDEALGEALSTPLELLRCAALLEVEVYQQLPAPRVEHALEAAVRALVPDPLPLVTSRPLTEHGRLWRGEVYVGVPGEGVTLEHAAHQAAHEHAVFDLRGSGLGERDLEAVALIALHRRLAGTVHAEAHRRWCARWGVREEHLDPARLTPEQRRVLAG